MITDVERYGEYPDFLYLVVALSAICITNISKRSTPWQKHEKKPLFKGFTRLDGGAYGTRTRDLLRDREAR